LVRITVFCVVLHHWISVPDVSEELLASYPRRLRFTPL